MSQVNHKYADKWNAVNATKTLMNLANRLAEETAGKQSMRNSIYMIVANIASDEEIESLKDIDLVVKEIIHVIALCTKQLKKRPEDVKRVKIQINVEGVDTPVNVIRVCYRSIIWHGIELLNACYHMAVCDKIKNDIYFTYNMSEHLRTIIYHGNDVEVMYALQLLNQLCFEKKICQHVKEDADLVAKLKEISGLENVHNVVKKSCQGIFWLSEEKSGGIENFERENLKLDVDKEKKIKNVDNKHIMISYNRDNRDLCLQIKKELEKLDFKIWIDVENIHGSSLESMANAIENSMCVLICMTEKYKQSSNCRAEAEYAFNIRTPIIPLIMQNNYQPSGWLGNF